MRARGLPWLVLLLGGISFLLTVAQLKQLPLRLINLEMTTALPRFVQVALAGGDRYLAANVDVFRALTVSGNPSANKLHVQGQIQTDAAWLNPAHEDNYYVAAALLSWSGELDAADEVLARATAARPFDFYPPFFRGFNHFYFLHEPAAGAVYMRQAAPRADSDQNRLALESIAARWTEKGAQPEEAIRMLTVMQQTTRADTMKRSLQERIDNLKQLMALRDAASRYRDRYGLPPRSLRDLVTAGLLKRLPPNPPWRLFVLDKNGVPDLIDQPPVPQQKP